jgi:hypothetical protein
MLSQGRILITASKRLVNPSLLTQIEKTFVEHRYTLLDGEGNTLLEGGGWGAHFVGSK